MHAAARLVEVVDQWSPAVVVEDAPSAGNVALVASFCSVPSSSVASLGGLCQPGAVAARRPWKCLIITLLSLSRLQLQITLHRSQLL